MNRNQDQKWGRVLPGLSLVHHQSFVGSDCGCCDVEMELYCSPASFECLQGRKKSGKQRMEWQHPHLGCRGGRLHGAGAAAVLRVTWQDACTQT